MWSTLCNNIETQLERGYSSFAEALASMHDRFPSYGSKDGLEDVLYLRNDSNTVNTSRKIRATDSGPQIHYRLIASGPLVIKSSGKERGDIIERLEVVGSDALCFEMEACGVMDSFPFLVIRGISDYCDSHKHDDWQPYAATVAACYAGWLLQVLQVSRRSKQLQDQHAVGMYNDIVSSDRAGTKR